MRYKLTVVGHLTPKNNAPLGQQLEELEDKVEVALREVFAEHDFSINGGTILIRAIK